MTVTTKKADADKPANIAPATDFEASGATIEPGAKKAADLKHPAVDNNPRENTTAEMNRIDFNDPTLSQQEAVAKNLKDG